MVKKINMAEITFSIASTSISIAILYKRLQKNITCNLALLMLPKMSRLVIQFTASHPAAMTRPKV